MAMSGRRGKIIFFLSLGVCLAAVAVAVGFGWIILNWREGIKVFLGIVFFGAIATGLILNTGFLVREIKKNEQHDSFINAVTHELKTPIASIRLYLQTLQRRDVEEGQRKEFYRFMLEDTDRLMGTVEQVLRAGEAGHKKHSKRVPLDFDRLVRECVDVARASHHLPAEAVRCEIAGNGNGGGTRVAGDSEDLKTAVSNLLDNAIKYSGERIEVAVKVETPDDKHVQLSVRDQGVGIPSHELKRIFKRFYRVPSLSMTGVKGTGLGLFIVRAIAAQHGGRVFAQSEGEGRGTTVVLQLPRSVA